MTTGSPVDIVQLPEVDNLQAPLPLPDAQDGQEAVIRAINVWLYYQDHLQTMLPPPNPTSIDATDGNYSPPPIGGPPPEEQPADKI